MPARWAMLSVRAGDQVVHGDDVVAFGQQPIAEMAAEESGPAGDKYTHNATDSFTVTIVIERLHTASYNMQCNQVAPPAI